MRKLIITCLIITMVLSSVTPAHGQTTADTLLKFKKVQVLTTTRSDFTSTQKSYIFDQNSYFFIRQISFNTDLGNYVTSFLIPGAVGKMYYYDAKKNLVVQDLKEGNLPLDSVVYIETDQYAVLMGQAYRYKDMGSGTILSLPANRQPISLKKNGDGWQVTYSYKQEKGSYGILWGAASKSSLIDFTNPVQKFVWSGYDLSNKARLGFDGYYYSSPNTYAPTDKNAFWRIPSMYVVSAFIRTGGSKAADMIGNAMLVNAANNLNTEGYFPSLPESTWLKKDYAIGGGFFDTRFNSDMGETYLLAYQKFGNELYRDVYLQLGEYLIKHTEENHFTNISESGEEEGWLVEDYGYPESLDSHVALNHQLQEIHFLLMLYEQEKSEGYLEYAKLMIQGIKNIKDAWMMENGNLEYAYMADGTMGLTDYPYLTYNDLYKVQADIERILGERDPVLDELMASKKAWMDKNGITGYMK